MHIYFAEAPFVDPAHSELAQSLEALMPEFGATLITEPRPDLPLADASPVIRSADTMIANFEEPNDALRDKVLFAHSIGKSVLVGMDLKLDPVKVLSESSKPPYLELEKRSSRAYYVYKEDDKIRAVKHQRLGLFKMQLEIWLHSQALAERRAKKLPPSTEEFQVELPDRKRYGAEADARLAREDAIYRAHGLPGLDD